MGPRNLYPYGNYPDYYRSRNDSKWSDARISMLQKDWFDGKRVLDIGCNDGTVTLVLGYKHNPIEILGIDIDYTLINRAVENWQYLERREDYERSLSTLMQDIATLPVSYKLQLQASGELSEIQRESSLSLGPKSANFPGNTSFLVGNVLEIPIKVGFYDTVLCLSIVKWVHLNWGDAGLQELFRRIYSVLVVGGVFILEPQAWSSYKKLRNQSREIRTNYDLIRFRPKDFEAFILSLGFEIKAKMVPVEAKETFKRPIIVYVKV